MTFPVLSDDDVLAAIDVPDVVATMELAIREHAFGNLVSPPRFSVDVEKGSLVFTAGAATGEVQALGFRVYETFKDDSPDHTQLVAVFDSETGAFKGIALGDQVGLLRTGGIGGVAVEYLAKPDVRTMAVIGSGSHARMQTRAAASVRNLDEIRVYSPKADHRDAAVRDLDDELGGTVVAAASAKAAVEEADIVICATTSRNPVFEHRWLAPGAHVTTLGPKYVGAHELPMETVKRANTVVTDSLAQVKGYAEYKQPFFIEGDRRAELVELSTVVGGDHAGRAREDDLTVFCSVGLAGTEVVLADEILRRVA
ncbi:ornithine cyclodeaminase family protein [Haladaptatus sp. GCM10025707]|uniref:ornithine cyclodeaminase family protein n=1 Tax=unclassified Haladaptatus TaxID=2622732 RepID=UPI0023E857BE|nr:MULTISPECIES: ornithine cyclodeaminase family protein [unclassified Haladaptatus]